MKKLLMLSFATITSSLFTLTAQSWLWARQGRNNVEANNPHCIAIDNAHNAYLTGNYSDDTLIFNSDTLVSTTKNKQEQTFLVKYNENGNLLWARTSQASKNGWGTSQAVATDGQNNVYVTGNFHDTLYFQSFNVEDTYVTKKINNNVFLAKYDENGNTLWVKQSKDDGVTAAVNSGQSLITDKTGNIYVTGYFQDTVYFSSDTLKGTSGSNFFLVKYNSLGNAVWAKQAINGKSINDGCGILGSNSIAIDKLGYVYVTGYFTDTVYFGSKSLTSTFEDAFIVKYDSNGNAIWANQSHNASSKSSANAYGICTDKNYNVYITGNFIDTLYFGATTLIGPYITSDIYWAKFDSAGNVLWAKQSFDLDGDAWECWGINTDASSNLYLSGGRQSFGDSKVKVIFDSDTLQLGKNDTYPSVFIKFDSSGKVLNSYIFQGGGIAGEEPFAVDSTGCYVYFGGEADTSNIFGVDTIGPIYKHNTNFKTTSRPFIARWSDGECTDKGIEAIGNQSISVNIYPNPTNQKLNINFNGQITGLATLSIMDITGRELLTEPILLSSTGVQIDVSSLIPGMYFMSIRSKEFSTTQKFIKY